MERIVVISDANHVVAVIKLSGRIEDLREEFESIMDPGPNPRRYDTPTQQEWLEKVSRREEYLTRIYRGAPIGDTDQYAYGPETFVNWLVQEKGARRIWYTQYSMCEFD